MDIAKEGLIVPAVSSDDLDGNSNMSAHSMLLRPFAKR